MVSKELYVLIVLLIIVGVVTMDVVNVQIIAAMLFDYHLSF